MQSKGSIVMTHIDPWRHRFKWDGRAAEADGRTSADTPQLDPLNRRSISQHQSGKVEVPMHGASFPVRRGSADGSVRERTKKGNWCG
jgi:hypothetical protein